jgi:hypothetical protein
MATDGEDVRYLLAREADLWHTEGQRTQNRLEDLNQGAAEATKEQAWYDHCFRKHEEVAWELDKIENPQKYSEARDVVSLDDLDRQD